MSMNHLVNIVWLRAIVQDSDKRAYLAHFERSCRSVQLFCSSVFLGPEHCIIVCSQLVVSLPGQRAHRQEHQESGDGKG